MRFLIPDWKSFCKEDIEETLTNMGHEVIYYEKEPKNYRQDPKFRSELRKYIKSHHIDFVFSSNYYPVLSDVCQEMNLFYISWCYDSPLVLLYSKTIFHPCNYIFIFDSRMVDDLKRLGAKQVYYLPMAVNPDRLKLPSLSEEQRRLVFSDVSFVGALYNEKHNLYDCFDMLDEHTKGYLEGIMQAQRLLYGYSFLEESLTDDILKRLVEIVPLEPGKDGMETLAYLYANYFLFRKITQMDRQDILSALDQRETLNVKLYTPNSTPQFSHIKNLGTVHYIREMPYVFKYSRINLNITLRSIQSGIPLRAMDIMGAGGFLLTNHQNDFLRHFVPGEDYVSYESVPDMLEKIDYYLDHEKERQAIAIQGLEKVSADHTYKKRFQEIFSVVGI